jgi:glutathione synthase/RimK-type ligase-like ATP-grasp enzyme
VEPEAVEVHRVDIDPALTQTLLALTRYWRLDVVAFDLLVRDDIPVFLEANVNCDWRWFERRSGQAAVSDAVASWVAARFEELLGAAARSSSQSG